MLLMTVGRRPALKEVGNITNEATINSFECLTKNLHLILNLLGRPSRNSPYFLNLFFKA